MSTLPVLTDLPAAKIDKLSILGYGNSGSNCERPAGLMKNRVRSFDNTRAETVQFHTPLTLIAGSNGSGKTVRRSLHVGVRRFK